MSNADTNQASEDELDNILQIFDGGIVAKGSERGGYPSYFTEPYPLWIAERKEIARQKIQALIRTEKLKLLNELDKSMPTAEQLTTKYGYHIPDKQYGYKLALHDIREVLAKMEAEL